MAKMLYEGKAKKVFETENPNEVIIYYKDDATAMNGLKKGTIADKGIMNNTITSFFFDLLAKHGIPHHQIKKLSDREALCKKVSIIPMEVVTRNIAAGSLAKKMGVEEGYVMKRPIVEFYYKNDDLGDPMINADYAEAFGLATDAQVAEINAGKEKLMQSAQKLFAKVYEQSQGAQGAGPNPGAGAGPNPGPAPEGFDGDDVVDGDYKEV